MSTSAPAPVASQGPGTAALPHLVLHIDGNDLSADDGSALCELCVHQELSRPATCELTFREPRGALGTGRLPQAGASVSVRVEGREPPLFTGALTDVEHVYGPHHDLEVRLRAKDPLGQLARRRSVRAHVQVTAESLARELTADLGLQVQAAVPGPPRQQLVQQGETDLGLLAAFAAECGLYLTLREDTLHLVTLEGFGNAVSLELGRELLQASFAQDLVGQDASVGATGWDPRTAEVRRSRVDRPRASGEAARSPFERPLPDQSTWNDADAEGLAQAVLDRVALAARTFRGVVEGDPQLQPGTVVEIAGVADGLAGSFTLTSVTHRVDERAGFVTEVASLPPAPLRRPATPPASLGVVTRVDDPDGLGRVRVSLPTYGDVESEWLEVLSAAAGPGKGIVALPDVGDRVLVLFTHGDVARGVVLGGLFGPEAPPDPGIAAGRVKRFLWRTPGGHSVQLDDEGAVLKLEDSRGSRLELAPELLRLHAATDLLIDAPGHALTIRAQRVDFERG